MRKIILATMAGVFSMSSIAMAAGLPKDAVIDGVVPFDQRVGVKIATYNIMASRYGSTDNIVKAIKKIDADIIAIQEVDNKTGRSGENFAKGSEHSPVDQAKYIAEQTGMNYMYCKTIDFDGGEYGTALLSKYPLTVAKKVHLPNADEVVPGMKHAEDRMACGAYVQVPGLPAPIMAAVTHIANGASDNILEAQTRKIVGEFSTVAFPNAFPIVMGDFNAVPWMPSNLIMRREFNMTEKTGRYTAPSFNPYFKLDYIWTSRAQIWQTSNLHIPKADEKITDDLSWMQVSDHLPVWATFTLVRK